VSEVKRKKGETFESFIRRFTKRMQQSGKLIQARKIRYHEHAKSRNLRRASALRRHTISEEREYLKKVGKLKEDPRDNYRRR
jgi:ribosomal protein S21